MSRSTICNFACVSIVLVDPRPCCRDRHGGVDSGGFRDLPCGYQRLPPNLGGWPRLILLVWRAHHADDARRGRRRLDPRKFGLIVEDEVVPGTHTRARPSSIDVLQLMPRAAHGPLPFADNRCRLLGCHSFRPTRPARSPASRSGTCRRPAKAKAKATSSRQPRCY